MLNLIEPIPWVDAAIPWALLSVLLFYLGGTLGWTMGVLETIGDKLPPGHRVTSWGWVRFTLICVFWPVLVLITPVREVADGEDNPG